VQRYRSEIIHPRFHLNKRPPPPPDYFCQYPSSASASVHGTFPRRGTVHGVMIVRISEDLDFSLVKFAENV
jgi:hypothetical protein